DVAFLNRQPVNSHMHDVLLFFHLTFFILKQFTLTLTLFISFSERFTVVGPSHSIVSYVGEDVILPASLSPALDAEGFEVRCLDIHLYFNVFHGSSSTPCSFMQYVLCWASETISFALESPTWWILLCFPHLNLIPVSQTHTSSPHLAGFSPGVSGWLVAFFVLLVLCLAVTPLLVIQWRRMRADVTFDPETANPYLIVSEDGKEVRHTDTRQRVTDNPKRFDCCVNVLAREGFTSGRHYWEVEVGGKTKWTLGVARESVNRKGDITLSPDDGFWTVWLRNENEYKALHDSSVILPLRVKPQTVGVFLDYDEGQVSFYNAQSRSHLYTFTDSFTEPLYPYFSPEPNDGGKNAAPLVICPLNSTKMVVFSTALDWFSSVFV
uniref:B30.2/SPRY domain-containing protein n=1 Tax=Erpetoichthys calabaricus TaxID=27687 RepID=A0A8C4XDA0_ERPCA